MADRETLAAFREVTGWTDERAIHYAGCDLCVPICGHEEEDCPVAMAMRQEASSG